MPAQPPLSALTRTPCHATPWRTAAATLLALAGRMSGLPAMAQPDPRPHHKVARDLHEALGAHRHPRCQLLPATP